MEAIHISNLSFHYSNQLILDNVNISVPKGSIYGFIGHNGAGKTTTIKLLLNLLDSKTGKIEILGKDLQSNRNWCLSKIGSLVEYPGVYAHLNARENLKAKCIALGMSVELSNNRIKQILELIKLDHVKSKKVKHFSQGMKQRLGIGLALISDPEILVLDEPTNGLDPNGIKEMRELIIRLSKAGKSIFISSHLLTEVEKFCTHVALIDQGKILFAGELQELILQNKQNHTLEIITDDIEKSLYLLQAMNIKAIANEQYIEIQVQDQHEIAAINKKLVLAGINVYALKTSNKSLEQLFFSITNKEYQLN